MIRDVRGQGTAIFTWGGLLNIPQLIGGVIFIGTVEGQAMLVVAGQIHRRRPFSRLIGICHLPWLAMPPLLAYRLAGFDHSVALKAWAACVAATVFISLVFDILDIHRYTRDEKTFARAR